ncbi:MAG: hypothetical protein ACI9NN_001705, partial [Bacteroidia bacterium]
FESQAPKSSSVQNIQLNICMAFVRIDLIRSAVFSSSTKWVY